MKIKLSILTVAAFYCFIACKKNGTGGDAKVSVDVKHHEQIIPGATVYIKYGASEFPGESGSLYDDQKVCDLNGHAVFSGLLPGQYYFYGVGYDSSIQEAVKGGVPLGISRKNKKSTIDLLVPVTE
jgi:hypothetical protein